MKELRIQFRVKNNRLLARREAEGKTIREMADAVGISYAHYQRLESLVDAPLDMYGDFRPVAKAVAAHFGVIPEELWPAGVLAVKQRVVERTFDAEEVRHLLAGVAEPPMLPDHYVERAERLEQVQTALSKLSQRQQVAVKMRTVGATLDEVARKLGVTRERARQIEIRAYNRIRDRVERGDREDTTVRLSKGQLAMLRTAVSRGWLRTRNRARAVAAKRLAALGYGEFDDLRWLFTPNGAGREAVADSQTGGAQ